jgi:two-component system, OmpR family, response regulator TrcR
MSRSDSARASRRSVLVIEDDPTNAMVITDYLAAHGFEVTCAGDGEEGLARFAEMSPDVVIVDMLLPQQSGLQVVRALRASPGGQQVPILMMSAVWKDAYPDQPRPDEVQGYLVKPFRMSSLVERIRELFPDEA